MKCIVDLTNAHFDRIDFTEARIIDFYCRKTLPSEFDFTVWGATLLLSSNWNHDKNFLLGYEDDMYVSGIGTVRMNGVVSGNIEVYAYDNIKDNLNRSIFAKNKDGSELTYKKQWGKQEYDDTLEEYLWECVITWPYGFCNLKINCNGSVSFDFDVKDLVTVKDYLKNPKLYTFQE